MSHDISCDTGGQVKHVNTDLTLDLGQLAAGPRAQVKDQGKHLPTMPAAAVEAGSAAAFGDETVQGVREAWVEHGKGYCQAIACFLERC